VPTVSTAMARLCDFRPYGAGRRCAEVRVMTKTITASTDGSRDFGEKSDARHGGRVVVGVDGSAASVDALRRGVRIAEALNGTLEAVTTWRFQTSGVFEDVESAAEGDAQSILGEAAGSVFGGHPPVWFSSAARQGKADQVLIEQSRGAEMLIVGSRGHGGVAGVLLGSVSARCAERAHCPVLVIH